MNQETADDGAKLAPSARPLSGDIKMLGALAEVTEAQRTIEQAQMQLEDAAVRAVEWGASARDVAEARGIANPAWVYAVLRRAHRSELIAPYERRTGGRRAQADA